MSLKNLLRVAAGLLLFGSLAFGMTVLDLQPPGYSPFLGTSIGNGEVNVVFDVLTDFSIDSAGIKFEPLTGGTTEILLQIWAVAKDGANNGTGTRGAAPLASNTAAVSGAGLVFHDVPISFDFMSGNRYAVGFSSVNPAGWGQFINTMEFFLFDAAPPADPPFTVGGVVTVLDGGFDGNFRNENFVHVRLDQTQIPEPSSVVLLGSGLLLLARFKWAARKRG